MIEGIVTDMETVEDMEIGTDMALTDGVVINRAVTDMVTDKEMVVRRRGVTKISRRVTGLLVLVLNVEKLDIWLKIVRKVVRAAGKNDLLEGYRLRLVRLAIRVRRVLGLISSWFILRVCVLVSVLISSRGKMLNPSINA
nr:hypothetical protein [Tanacetum cinerariifolium]